jgi:hypothetical protein
MPAPAKGVDATWYSVDVAGIHLITLSNYHPFASGSAQYNWLKADLAAIDRGVTPWVLVNTHAPWYNSNTAHQGDGEAQRQALEKMLYDAGVDLVMSGHVRVDKSWGAWPPRWPPLRLPLPPRAPLLHTHTPCQVHAYERHHRVYNNKRDSSGPVYIGIGDGGNREGLASNWLTIPDISAFHQATYVRACLCAARTHAPHLLPRRHSRLSRTPF